MTGVAGVVVRIATVAAGVVVAYIVAAPIDVWQVAVAIAALTLGVSGALANRWWAAGLIPLAFAVWMFGAYLADPSGFLEGSDMPGWVYAVWFFAASVLAGLCVAVGVAARRVIERARTSGSRPFTRAASM